MQNLHCLLVLVKYLQIHLCWEGIGMVIVLVQSQGMSGPGKSRILCSLYLWRLKPSLVLLKHKFGMLFDFMLSQSFSRPGDLSADIARVGDVAGDVINFNVLLNCRALIFFSTNIA